MQIQRTLAKQVSVSPLFFFFFLLAKREFHRFDRRVCPLDFIGSFLSRTMLDSDAVERCPRKNMTVRHILYLEKEGGLN